MNLNDWMNWAVMEKRKDKKIDTEYWINPTADYRTDHILTKEEYEEYYAEDNNGEWVLARIVEEDPHD